MSNCRTIIFNCPVNVVETAKSQPPQNVRNFIGSKSSYHFNDLLDDKMQVRISANQSREANNWSFVEFIFVWP